MKKRVCGQPLYIDPDGGKMYTMDEWIDHVHDIETEHRQLEYEYKKQHCAVVELTAENEQLKKDNRRMLLLIAVMEKMLGVELTELI